MTPRDGHTIIVPRNVLGRTGIDVSLLGFGAEAIGRAGRSFEAAEQTLHAVLDAGVTLIDTAAAYGNSEAFIGRALGDAHARGEFTLVTKCGWINPDYRAAWSPAELRTTIDQSLERLRIDAVDVLLLHSCDRQMLERGEVIEVLRAARGQGKARYIGYSGDNDALKFAVESEVFDVIECSFNLLDQANAQAIDAARQRNLGVLIKRPIANAVPGASTRPRSEYAAQYWPRWQAMALSAEHADRLDGGWLEAALRFSAFREGVHCVLIGSSNADHMRDNAKWLTRGPLETAMLHHIRDEYENAGIDWPALG